MNAVTPAVIDRPTEAAQAGEIQAAWQATPEAFMVIGWCQGAAAMEGTVAHHRQGAPKGRFQGVSWPSPSGPAQMHNFVAAFQLPTGSRIAPGDSLVLAGAKERGGVLAHLPSLFHEAAPFAQELARLAAGHALTVARFLIQALAPSAGRTGTGPQTLLRAFLERASTLDGCVELVAGVHDHCTLLQGWGAPPAPEHDVVVIGSTIEGHKATIAQFARPDMRGTASGQVIVLPPSVSSAASDIEAVVLLDRRGLRWRPVLPEAHRLNGADGVSHLRGILPNLQCPDSTRNFLTAGLRPRFDGRFTLYDAGHKMRLAIDLAASAGAAGAYLTGWLFDPTHLVSNIRLRGVKDGSVRIDDIWTRIPRTDVTDAFRGDPAFGSMDAGTHRHGFAVFARGIDTTTSGPLYLDVSFTDGQCGFVPITAPAAITAASRSALIASVDLHKPSGQEIIESQLAPFFAGLADCAASPDANVVQPIPPQWTTAIVVPLPLVQMPRALLSQFLRDPLGNGEGLVFVYGDDWTDSDIDALHSLATFYEVPHALLQISGTVSAASALAATVSVCAAERLLLLAPNTVGRSAGWRRDLHAVLDNAPTPSCVSPTVVYEDNAVRFAGRSVVEQLASTPFVRVRRELAGLPVGVISANDPVQTTTASPACCLMPRAAITGNKAIFGLMGIRTQQEIALTALLQAAQVAAVWAPTAQVYSADLHTLVAGNNTERVRRLIDGWCLRERLATES